MFSINKKPNTEEERNRKANNIPNSRTHVFQIQSMNFAYLNGFENQLLHISISYCEAVHNTNITLRSCNLFLCISNMNRVETLLHKNRKFS
jgi:hypothetical protein